MNTLVTNQSFLVPELHRTIGIDQIPWRIGPTQITFWDFAGQEEYYTPHQIFLSKRALYLLVIDIVTLLNDETAMHLQVQQWVAAIESKVRSRNRFVIMHARLMNCSDRGLLADERSI